MGEFIVFIIMSLPVLLVAYAIRKVLETSSQVKRLEEQLNRIEQKLDKINSWREKNI